MPKYRATALDRFYGLDVDHPGLDLFGQSRKVGNHHLIVRSARGRCVRRERAEAAGEPEQSQNGNRGRKVFFNAGFHDYASWVEETDRFNLVFN
jgi:hypothetical protein